MPATEPAIEDSHGNPKPTSDITTELSRDNNRLRHQLKSKDVVIKRLGEQLTYWRSVAIERGNTLDQIDGLLGPQ